MKYLNSKVICKSSKKKGPKVIIFCGIHGDEISGVKALNYLIPKLKIISGTVYFVYSNLKAIKQDKRFIEFNLNRCFLHKQPKEMKSTLEGKTAKQLLKILKTCDYSLDLHSSKSSKNIPFLICEKNCTNYTNCFPTKIILFGTNKTHPGSTDGYMNDHKKIGFCLESGTHKSKKSVKIAKLAVINFLTELKMINKKNNFSKKDFSKNNCDKKIFYKALTMYKNKKSFKLTKKFSDFEEIKQKTIIGTEGSKKVYLNKNDVILFPTNTKKINQECFVKCKKVDS